jgi:predicted metal-dependent hydrolase
MLSADNFTSDGKLKKINWAKENTPVHWLKKNPLLTHLSNIYIIVTTEIERFTVKEALLLKNKIKDKSLAMAWDTFIKEEMSHAYQHAGVSQDLKRHKYPVDFMMKFTRMILNVYAKIMGEKSRLALVLGMELYAHGLAVASLESNLFSRDQSAIYDFLRWHAEEELSHFDLCSRVYRDLGGKYFRRAAVQIYFIFLAGFLGILFWPLLLLTDLFQGRRIKFKDITHTFSFTYAHKAVAWRRIKHWFSVLMPD